MEISFLPRWVFKWFSENFARQNDLNILVSSLLILLVFLYVKDFGLAFFDAVPHFCLFLELFDFHCPFCGTTRAFFEMANGNIWNAINYNCGSLFFAFFFILQFPLRVISLTFENLRKVINTFSKKFGNVTLFIFVFNWAAQLFFLLLTQ